jgi:hypothetical protein
LSPSAPLLGFQISIPISSFVLKVISLKNSRVFVFGSSLAFASQEPKMSLRRGSKVWAEDKDLAWVAAEALDFVGKQILVVNTSGKKVGILFFSEGSDFCTVLGSSC